jgi:hypothetical protein
MAQVTADGLGHAIFSADQPDAKGPALRCYSMLKPFSYVDPLRKLR